RDRQIHIHQALRAGEQILEHLEMSPDFKQAEFGGELRRFKETVSQIVIVAAAKRPGALIDHFLRFPLVARTEERTDGHVVSILSEGFKVRLIAVTPKDFAVALFNETGSEAHLQKLNELAAKGELKSQRKRTSKSGKSPAIELKSEAEIYRRLGMQYVPPELREDVGEVEAALAGKIPEDLVTTDDIRGMVHCHTTY